MSDCNIDPALARRQLAHDRASGEQCRIQAGRLLSDHDEGVVVRWLEPPPSHPFLPCGAFQPWQGKQDWPEEPPVSPEPWQVLQYDMPEELPGAALAVAPCWLPADQPVPCAAELPGPPAWQLCSSREAE